MKDHKNLLRRFKSNIQTWSDYQEFLKLSESEMEPFFELAKSQRNDNFKNILKIYIPDKRFPAISITGSECELNCEHCNKKYLNGMKDLRKNEELKRFLYRHHENNGVGVLISGDVILMAQFRY